MAGPIDPTNPGNPDHPCHDAPDPHEAAAVPPYMAFARALEVEAAAQCAATATHFYTLKGNCIDLGDPDPGQIDINEIANSLSLKNRFSGHMIGPYSVAQHVVLLVDFLRSLGVRDPAILLWALMHDAGEYVMGDMVTPTKVEVPEVVTVEDRVLRVVIEKYGLTWPIPKLVRRADNCLVHLEASVLQTNAPWVNPTKVALMQSVKIRPWPWTRARRMFLCRFNELQPLVVKEIKRERGTK